MTTRRRPVKPGSSPAEQRRALQFRNIDAPGQKSVFFASNTAVAQGYGVCYQEDNSSVPGEGVTRYGYPTIAVNRPSSSRNWAFAGVAVRTYSARSAGRWIQIYEPGAFCQVQTLVGFTLSTGMLLTARAGIFRGQFSEGGIVGAGSARVLTVVSGPSGELVEVQLLPGDQSGLSEHIEVSIPAAHDLMAGGTTFISGALASGNSTSTLAEGTYRGQRKRFECLDDLGGTYAHVVTLTSGLHPDNSTDVSAVEFYTTGDAVDLEWTGTHWRVIYVTDEVLLLN